MIKKIVLVSHTHTDIGYTEMPHKVMALQVKYLRQAMRLARMAAEKTPPERFPWTIEAMVVVREFLKVADEEEKKEFFDLVRAGLVEITGYDGQIQTQLMNLQELDEELKFARTMAQKENLPLNTVVLDDIGGFSWNLPQMLNQCGITNYVMGVGGWRVLSPIADLPHLFRLRGVDGKSSILVYLPGLKKGGNPAEVKFLLAQYGFGIIYVLFPYRGTPVSGDFASASESFAGDEALKSLVRRFENEGYPYDTLLLQNGSDNAGQCVDLPDAVARWNSRYPELQLEIGTFNDFFSYIEQKYGASIPEYSGELTCTWSEHVLTHAKGLGEMHEAFRTLSNADMLSQSLSLSPRLMAEYLAIREDVLAQIRLFCDHTFGLEAWGFRGQMERNHRLHTGGRVNDYSHRSWEVKQNYASRALAEARKGLELCEKAVIRDSLAPVDLSTRFSDVNCPDPEVTFFNPLPYPNGSLLRFHGEYLGEVQVNVDGRVIDCDAIYNNNSGVDYFFPAPAPLGANGFLRAQIIANAKLKEFTSPFNWKISDGILDIYWDNARLQIGENGDIHSYQVDGVELQDDSAGTHINDFKGYLVDGVLPVGKELGLTEKVSFLPIAKRDGKISVTYSGRYLMTIQLLRFYGEGEKTIQVESEIELHIGSPELFIRNRVRKISDYHHEAGYFVFPIRVERQNWKLETNQQGYVHDYRSEKLEGAALQNFAFQDFAVISDGRQGAMLQSFHAGIISVGETPKYFSPELVNRSPEAPHLFLYCYNNLWVTNTPQEQLSGDLLFDVIVSPFVGNLPQDSGSYSTFAAKRMQDVIPLSGRVEKSSEFLSIDSDKITAYYLNEDGQLFLHLVNYSRTPQTFSYRLRGKTHTLTLAGCEIFRRPLE